MAENSPNAVGNLMQSYMLMQNPMAALQFQQQQALAQQMMQEGSQQPDPTAMVGNQVVRVNPLTNLARAGDKMAGAYLQKEQLNKLGQMMQQTPIGGMASPASSGANPQAIGQVMQGGNPIKEGAVTGNPQSDMMYFAANPSGYYHDLAERQMPTPGQKEFFDPTMGPSVQGKYAKEAILPDQTYNGKSGVPIDMRTGLPLGQPAMNPMLPAQIQAESGGNPNAISPAGAQGIAQIMPATAAQPGYGVKPLQGMQNGNPMTAPVPEQLRFANDYDNAMQQKFGDPRLAAAAYNAGPGRVEAALKQLPQETQNYVPQVTGGQQTAQSQSGFGFNPVQRAKDTAAATKTGDTEASAKAALDKLYGNANTINSVINQMKEVAPQTNVGKIGEDLSYPLSRDIGSRIPSYLGGGGTHAAATDQFNNLSERLFLNEIPAIAQSGGGRIDIPLVRAGHEASAVDKFAPVQSKLNVTSQLQDALGRTLQNANNYYKNITGKDYVPEKPLDFNPNDLLINSQSSQPTVIRYNAQGQRM